MGIKEMRDILMRDIKIDEILKDPNYDVRVIEKYYKYLYRLYSELSDDFIVTGSLALLIYGIKLNRDINDIDIIIKDIYNYEYTNDECYDDEMISNRLGRTTINGVTVDCFLNENCTYNTFIYKNIKFNIHLLSDIIELKSSIKSSKHKGDIENIFKGYNKLKS